MIAQGFGCTKDFPKKWNNSAYFRLRKILCGFKDQARGRHPGEKCELGLGPELNILFVVHAERDEECIRIISARKALRKGIREELKQVG